MFFRLHLQRLTSASNIILLLLQNVTNCAFSVNFSWKIQKCPFHLAIINASLYPLRHCEVRTSLHLVTVVGGSATQQTIALIKNPLKPLAVSLMELHYWYSPETNSPDLSIRVGARTFNAPIRWWKKRPLRGNKKRSKLQKRHWHPPH